MIIRLSETKIGHNSALSPIRNRYSRYAQKHPYLSGVNWRKWSAHRHCFEHTANPADCQATNKSLARHERHWL